MPAPCLRVFVVNLETPTLVEIEPDLDKGVPGEPSLRKMR